jgi:hypothetical protein
VLAAPHPTARDQHESIHQGHDPAIVCSLQHVNHYWGNAHYRTFVAARREWDRSDLKRRKFVNSGKFEANRECELKRLCSVTPVFGPPTHPICDFLDSATCKASGNGDFGQLRRQTAVANTRCDLMDSWTPQTSQKPTSGLKQSPICPSSRHRWSWGTWRWERILCPKPHARNPYYSGNLKAGPAAVKFCHAIGVAHTASNRMSHRRLPNRPPTCRFR